MEAIVLLGGPGSGKGTAAELLAAAASASHLSTGTLFRDAMARQTPLGRRIRPYMAGDRLVPDEWATEALLDRLEQAGPYARVVLDGFPRTLPQAQALESHLVRTGSRLLRAFLLEMADDQLRERLRGRRVCADCGHGFHLALCPPARKGICDRCGGRLVRRHDDRDSAIPLRIQVYRDHAPLVIDFYECRDALKRIRADQSPSAVARELAAALPGAIAHQPQQDAG
jgi:adenylate kinase